MNHELLEEIKPFSVFKNSDESVCTVIAIAKHSENKDENLVIYCNSDAEDSTMLYAKPANLFLDERTRSICPGISNNINKMDYEEGREVTPYSLWVHFKGPLSLVLGVAQNTENGEKYVVYRCMKSNGITNHKDGVYARPIDMFLSPTDRKKYSEEEYPQNYRFKKTSNGIID